jgi:large subunit ribosomal protein L20
MTRPGLTDRVLGTVLLQVKYSEFMYGMKQDNIWLNRKVLSEVAMQEPYSFKALVERAKHATQAGAQARSEAQAKGMASKV